MKIQKWFVVMSLFASTSVFAQHAGNGAGNGGDGILIDGKPYLLDLVEYGVEQRSETPSFSVCAVSEYLGQQLNASITEARARKEVLGKLNELCAISPSHAVMIAMASRQLTFSWLNLAIMDIHDEETPVGYHPKSIVQLAARQRQRVMIDQSLWNRLDSRNKAALILHEVVYAMVSPKKEGRYFRQSSPEARTIVGSLYSGDLASTDPTLRARILAPIAAVGFDGDVSTDRVLRDGSFGRYELFLKQEYERSFFTASRKIKTSRTDEWMQYAGELCHEVDHDLKSEVRNFPKAMQPTVDIYQQVIKTIASDYEDRLSDGRIETKTVLWTLSNSVRMHSAKLVPFIENAATSMGMGTMNIESCRTQMEKQIAQWLSQ